MKKNKLLIIILLLLCLIKIDITHAENVYKEYKIGDKIMYNGMNFYVIENSDSTKDYVTLLKSEPLTADEVNKYGGVGTENNHVNMYVTSDTSKSYYQKSLSCNGGCMAYYTSLTCGYDLSGNLLEDGCQNNYLDSEVKYVVDNWSQSQLNDSDLIEDSLGYKIRLLTVEELINNLGYEKSDDLFLPYHPDDKNTPTWVRYNKYDYEIKYWTMSKSQNYIGDMMAVGSAGLVWNAGVRELGYAVRPVINLKKTAIPVKKSLTNKEFNIGDLVEYDNMLFYVIENSTEKDNSVTLLKAEPLSVDEVNAYGIGHVNMYTNPAYLSYQTAHNINGYGGMQYYSSITCGYDGLNWVSDGCRTDYESSEVKYVVDAWATAKFNELDLIEDSLGYKTRLITYEELTANLGYEKTNKSTIFPSSNGGTPEWVYDKNYHYWTMSAYGDSNSGVWQVSEGGYLSNLSVGIDSLVRPVVTLKKITEDNSENIETEKDKNKDIDTSVTEDNKKPNQIVIVPDTLLKKPIIFVVLGVILIAISITIYILIRRKIEFKKK